jgi:hypothetical protein
MGSDVRGNHPHLATRGRANQEQRDAFIGEGERLRDLVGAELGPDIEVVLDHR